jgi:hypothetical protein
MAIYRTLSIVRLNRHAVDILSTIWGSLVLEYRRDFTTAEQAIIEIS